MRRVPLTRIAFRFAACDPTFPRTRLSNAHITLLATKSIVYAGPAKGGLSGVVAARVIDRLGIAEPMKAKTILVPGAQAADVVAKGEAELGIAQASEIVPVAGAQLVGPLPGELAVMARFTGGIGAESASVPAAKALIEFLTGPEAAPSFKEGV